MIHFLKAVSAILIPQILIKIYNGFNAFIKQLSLQNKSYCLIARRNLLLMFGYNIVLDSVTYEPLCLYFTFKVTILSYSV